MYLQPGGIILDYTRLIIAFGALWLMQAFFAFFQSKSINKKFVELQKSYTGHMGIGIARAKFNAGKGVILTVITDYDGLIVDFQLLSGYTVLARFKQKQSFIGQTVSAAAQQIKDKRLLKAFTQAVERINDERVKKGYKVLDI